MGSLDGKIGLIVGVANKRSLAWAIAQAAAARGRAAACSPTRSGSRSTPRSWPRRSRRRRCCCSATCRTTRRSTPCSPGIADAPAGSTSWSTASPSRRATTCRTRSATPRRDGFKTALDVSAYSLIALARGARPLFEARGGGVDRHPELPRQRPGVPELQRDGRGQGGARIDGALPGGRPRPAEHPRQRGVGRPGEDAGGRRHRRVLDHPRRGAREGAAAADDRVVGGGRRGGVPARARRHAASPARC